MSAAASPPVPPVTSTLADFVAATQWEGLPDAVKDDARRAIVNLVGATVAGTSDVSIERLVAAASPFFGAGRAGLIGRSIRVDAPHAAFLNAAAANVLDFDDTHDPTLIHPGATVLGAVLALAEDRGATGRELLQAFVLGVEVACRLGLAMHPTHYERGWHITATCGAVGAAAACAKLLRLPARRVGHAMGIAATQASGLIENLSSMAKSVGVGDAARNGLIAACQAEAGIDASPTALEGRFGFLHVMCDAPRPAAALDALGQRWESLNKCAKPYPCCALIFPVLDAVFDVREQPGFDVHAVESVRVSGSPLMLVRASRPVPDTGRESKLSIPHSVAVSLLRGRAGVAEFDDATAADPAVRALARGVSAVSEDGYTPDSAGVIVQLKDGRTFTSRIARGRGTPGRAMTDDEIRAKAEALLRHGAPELPAGGVLAAWEAIEDAPDVRPLVARAMRASPSA